MKTQGQALISTSVLCRGASPSALSATGTRARVARVRAEYPNQLDCSGVCFDMELLGFPLFCVIPSPPPPPSSSSSFSSSCFAPLGSPPKIPSSEGAKGVAGRNGSTAAKGVQSCPTYCCAVRFLFCAFCVRGLGVEWAGGVFWLGRMGGGASACQKLSPRETRQGARGPASCFKSRQARQVSCSAIFARGRLRSPSSFVALVVNPQFYRGNVSSSHDRRKIQKFLNKSNVTHL